MDANSTAKIQSYIVLICGTGERRCGICCEGFRSDGVPGCAAGLGGQGADCRRKPWPAAQTCSRAWPRLQETGFCDQPAREPLPMTSGSGENKMTRSLSTYPPHVHHLIYKKGASVYPCYSPPRITTPMSSCTFIWKGVSAISRMGNYDYLNEHPGTLLKCRRVSWWV
jgi:hypothetical protein